MIQIDMEIPKTCDDCPFHIYHSGKNYVCVATPLFYPMNLANYKDGRKDFCPLKEVSQEPILDKIRAEITEYGSIWVEYKITGRSDKDIEQLVSDVLKQAKEQVLDVIDKYKTETEE